VNEICQFDNKSLMLREAAANSNSVLPGVYTLVIATQH